MIIYIALLSRKGVYIYLLVGKVLNRNVEIIIL